MTSTRHMDAFRRGFLTRLAQYDQKIALELGTVVRAAESGAARRSPEQLAGIVERAAGRQDRAAELVRSLPATDPRHALALKRLQDNAGLGTMTGAMSDLGQAAAERARAAVPPPPVQHTPLSQIPADELEYMTRTSNRIAANAPGKALQAAPALPGAATVAPPRRRPAAIAGG